MPGLLIALDDATCRAANDTDTDLNLVSELHAAFAKGGGGGHPAYSRPRLDSAHCFCVQHYAGEVRYDARGFVRKNSEALTPDVQTLLTQATHPWLVAQHAQFVLRHEAPPVAASSSSPPPPPSFSFSSSSSSSSSSSLPSASLPSSPTGEALTKGASAPTASGALEKRGSRLRQASVGEQFRSQLRELIQTVNGAAVLGGGGSVPVEAGAGGVSGCAYVRCIKPNADRLPWTLDEASCAHQLRCAGMMEAVRIRRESFARRHPHSLFWQAFHTLPRPTHPATTSHTAPPIPSDPQERSARLAAALAEALGEAAGSWQSGRTKVFLRHSLAVRLDTWARVRRAAAQRSLRAAGAAWTTRRHVSVSALQRGWIRSRAVRAGRALRVAQWASRAGLSRWRRHVHSCHRALACIRLLQRTGRAWLAARREAASKATERARADVLSPPRLLGPGHASAPVFAHTSAPALIRAICVGKERAPPPTPQSPQGTPRPHSVSSADDAAPAAMPLSMPLSALPSGGLQQVQKVQQKVGHGRTIEQLGPKRAVCVSGSTSVAEAAQVMVATRTEAVLVVEDVADVAQGAVACGDENEAPRGNGPPGGAGHGKAAMPTRVAGILTVTDIARRVVASGRSPLACTVQDVMTCNPQTVSATDAADVALTAMITGAFRHVPVVSAGGGAPAILDLVRCLFDVIRMLERAQAAGEALIDAVSRQAAGVSGAGAGGDGSLHDALAPALRTLLAPSLSSLGASCVAPAVLPPSATLRDAAVAMRAPGVTAVLIATTDAEYQSASEDGTARFALLTPRSLLAAVAAAANGGAGTPSLSSLSALEASEGARPLVAPPNVSVLDALHLLQGERCSHAVLLDVDEPPATASPMALLDILQLVRASMSHAERSADAQQLTAYWGAAAALSDVGAPTARHRPRPGAPSRLGGIGEDTPCDAFSDAACSSPADHRDGEANLHRGASYSCVGYGDQCTVIDDEVRPEDSISMAGVPSNQSMVGGRFGGLGPSANGAMGQGLPAPNFDGSMLLKLRDPQGNLHRVKCMPHEGWQALQSEVQARLGGGGGHTVRALLYRDDDGDQVAIDSSEALLDAAQYAARVGHRLNVSITLAAATATTPLAVPRPQASKAPSQPLPAESTSAVSSFLGGLLAASALAVGGGLVIAAKAARR